MTAAVRTPELSGGGGPSAVLRACTGDVRAEVERVLAAIPDLRLRTIVQDAAQMPSAPPLALLVAGCEVGDPRPAFASAVADVLWWTGAEVLDDITDRADAADVDQTERWAAGVLAMQVLPVRALACSDLPDGVRAELCAQFAAACSDAIDGQLADLRFKRGPIDAIRTSDVLKIYRGKCGAAHAVTAQSAALAAGANDDRVMAWGEFGATFGVLRQLLNDRGDLLVGEDEDLRNGAPTLLLALAMQNATAARRSALVGLLAAARTDDQAREDARQALLEPSVLRLYLAFVESVRSRLHRLLQSFEPDSGFGPLLEAAIDASALHRE